MNIDNGAWRGAGSRVRAELPQGVVYASAFLMEKESNPEGYISPSVVRVAYDQTPFNVTDYVVYSDDDATQRSVAVHYLPKWIEDPNERFRGETPVPEEYLLSNGEELIDALAKVSVALPEETVVILGRAEGDYTFTAESAVPLEDAGTLPFYPNIKAKP